MYNIPYTGKTLKDTITITAHLIHTSIFYFHPSYTERQFWQSRISRKCTIHLSGSRDGSCDSWQLAYEMNNFFLGFDLCIFSISFCRRLRRGQSQWTLCTCANWLYRNEFGIWRIVYVFNEVGMELQSHIAHTGDSRLFGIGFSHANRIEYWNGTDRLPGKR